MKKLFLTGIAALFLATGAPAEEPPGHQLAFEAFAKNVWRFNDYKKCTAQVEFTIPPNPKDWLLRTDLSLANDAAEVVFDRTHLGRVLINNSGPDVRFRGDKRTSQSHVESVENDPKQTLVGSKITPAYQSASFIGLHNEYAPI